jgi:crotonobetainyl-CoA:carnitine CoA-transferase CaiB-like acyl-CoA transferase
MCAGLSGLTAGALLAGLGAEVSHVAEPPPAPPVDAPFLIWANRAKKPTSPVDLQRLLDEADICLTDAPSGPAQARGLDAVTLAVRNPGLVHVWLPTFGSTGRWSHLDYDPLLLSAVSGYADHYPTECDQPIAPVVPTFAYLQGAMGAAAAVAGLLGRPRDGRGRAVTVSGLHAVGAALATLMVKGIDVDKVASAGRSSRAGPFFRLYQGSDGQWFFLAALSPAIFFRALEAVGRMDIMVRDDVAGEFSNLIIPAVGLATSVEMERTFATRPAGEWVEVLRAAEVPAAPVWDRDTWAASEMAAHVTGWTEFNHPTAGDVRCPAFPLRLNLMPGSLEPAGDRNGTIIDRSSDLPLAGLKVLDMSTFLAAPFASALLADFGADVVKVEPIDGDPYRAHSISHAVANQHKRGAALDLKDPAAREAFLHLVGASDVLVDNARGDGLLRLGLDESTLARWNPSLIRCSVSAFGTQPPWAGLPGFDPVLQSTTGLAAAQGGDGPPAPSSAPVVDIVTGVLSALGILTAVYAREEGGTPRHVKTSLAAGAVFLQSGELTAYASRPPAGRGGPDFAGPDGFVHYYETADGWLAVAARTEGARSALLEACGVRADDMDGLADLFRPRTAEEWVDRLSVAGVPAAVVLRRSDAIHSDYLKDNGIIDQIEVPPFGRFLVVGRYADWRGASPPAGRGYRTGQDTVAVLAAAGVAPDAIGDLLGRGRAIAVD